MEKDQVEVKDVKMMIDRFILLFIWFLVFISFCLVWNLIWFVRLMKLLCYYFLSFGCYISYLLSSLGKEVGSYERLCLAKGRLEF